MNVVSNASPLIYFSMVGQMRLLKVLLDELYITPEVFEEIVTKGYGQFGEKEVKEATWIKRKAVITEKAISSYKVGRLSTPDVTVIQLALDIKADMVVVDDEALRNAVLNQKLPLIGTAGILLRAKQKNLIVKVKPILDKMIKGGFRLSSLSYRTILQKAGE